MKDIAIYTENINNFKDSKNSNYRYTFFSPNKQHGTIQITNQSNPIFDIKEYYKGLPFLFLFDNEQIISLEDNLNSSHICGVVDEFIIKFERIFNSTEKKVSKVFIKSNISNVFLFDPIWKDVDKCKNLVSLGNNFLLGKKPKYEYLFVFYKVIKDALRNKNLNFVDSYVKNILKIYPEFLEIVVLLGSYFYEQNNLYTALELFKHAKSLATKRSMYDFYPIIPNFHNSKLNELIQNTEVLIKKYDN